MEETSACATPSDVEEDVLQTHRTLKILYCLLPIVLFVAWRDQAIPTDEKFFGYVRIICSYHHHHFHFSNTLSAYN